MLLIGQGVRAGHETYCEPAVTVTQRTETFDDEWLS